MKDAALMLFTVATRTADFFITHQMCYEIRGDHVTNTQYILCLLPTTLVGWYVGMTWK